MSETKHTPGPWEVRNLTVWAAGGNCTVLDSPSGDLDHDCQADLQLAAAAPDLLAALEQVMPSLCACGNPLPIARNREWRYMTHAAAIAKAKGETP